MDRPVSLFFKALALVFAIVLVVLSWEGNIGKALACLVAPGALELQITSGSQTANASNIKTVPL